MNQTALLHIVERLEGLIGKLPDGIRRPILSELTPLKELFLAQRPPRFLFVGSGKLPMPEIVQAVFSSSPDEQISMAVTPVHRWADWKIDDQGSIAILDAREPDDSAMDEISYELKRQPADLVFLIGNDLAAVGSAFGELVPSATKIIALSLGSQKNGTLMEKELHAPSGVRSRLLATIQLGQTGSADAARLMSILTQELPNEAKIEMIRISHDREAQHHVAQILVKSTTAICTAIGAQPIPLADLPILTTLQLVMVSGIMYISGRERSLRAATEFIGALGANVGAGMLLREGTRALLKFFPGWGNVVCGMVAGAGTYAIGRAATAYFLEGVTLKEARRTYLTSRKKQAHRALPAGK